MKSWSDERRGAWGLVLLSAGVSVLAGCEQLASLTGGGSEPAPETTTAPAVAPSAGSGAPAAAAPAAGSGAAPAAAEAAAAAPAAGEAGKPEGAAAPGGPAGDTCATAQALPLQNGQARVSGQLNGFTNSIGDRIEVTGYSWSGSDVFYAVDLVQGTQVTMTLNDQGSFDGGLYVLTDCNNPVASVVGGLDTTAQRPFEFTAPSTGRFIVVVDAWQASMTQGSYELTLSARAPGARAGDSCAAALPLVFNGGSATAAGSLAGFTSTINDSIQVTGYSWTGHDVFYSMNAAAGDVFTLQLDERGTFDGGLYIISDCNNPVGSVVAGADTTATSTLTFTAPTAGAFVVAVDSYAGATSGDYQLTVNSTSAAAGAASTLCQVGAGIQVMWNGNWYPATVK